MRWLFALGIAAVSLDMPLVAANVVVPLWPKGAPGEKSVRGEEKDTTTPQDHLVGGRPVIRIGNVTVPTITVYQPDKAKNTGAAVLVFPGGGYRILAIDLEGSEVCEWLSSIGITGILVKYRVPENPELPRYAAPLEDAQRAVGIVRDHAREWHLDPEHIGVLGFSAGGHLAAVLSNNFEKRTYTPVDDSDRVSCRPAFVLLIYPAYLSVNDAGEKLAPELPVTKDTPPTFIVQTEDDQAFVEGSLLYYRALKKAKVPAEMHLFSTGGHGYGLRPSTEPVSGWPKLAEEWLRLRGILPNSTSAKRD